jgi:hypothetical protein
MWLGDVPQMLISDSGTARKTEIPRFSRSKSQVELPSGGQVLTGQVAVRFSGIG